MARITIEDCLARIPNRFELTLAATNRARQITAGSAPMVDADRDKPTVIALREMAAGKIGIEMLTRTGPTLPTGARVRVTGVDGAVLTVTPSEQDAH